MLIGLGVVVVFGGGIGGVMAWGPLQRSRQLTAIDACRTAGRSEEGRQLALAFAQQWGARSAYVSEAIAAGHGPLEARIEWCRAGGHILALAKLLADDQLTPAQRGQTCTALAEQVGDTDLSGDATLMRELSTWALATDAPPELAAPALHLLVTIAGPDSAAQLARAIMNATKDQRTPERLQSLIAALCQVIERRGNGVSPLIAALDSPARGALLNSTQVRDCVRDNAVIADTAAVLSLLTKPDTRALGMTALGGKRFLIADADAKTRTVVTAEVLPFLSPSTDDATLASALQVVRQQRLLGAQPQVLALLPRLAAKRPPALMEADLGDLLGRALVSTATPEAHTAAEAMISGLTSALAKTDTRSTAAGAFARVQARDVEALRAAFEPLAAAAANDPACASALANLIGKVYGRDDLVKSAQTRGWNTIVSEERRQHLRIDAIKRWLSDHADETNAHATNAMMVANKAELTRIRDELQSWQDSKQPLAIGVTSSDLTQLAERTKLMLYSVIKATH